MGTKKKPTITEQIKTALDGRTQRWLSLEIRMPEDVLSRKLKGLVEFSEEDIKVINERLSSHISK